MAKFVSRQRDFRIFLEMTAAGGRWADFGDTGECEVTNPEDAEKLRKAPNFGKDFYEVGVEKKEAKKEKPKVMYGCPFCDYKSKSQRSVATHSMFKRDNYHKKIALADALVIGNA